MKDSTFGDRGKDPFGETTTNIAIDEIPRISGRRICPFTPQHVATLESKHSMRFARIFRDSLLLASDDGVIEFYDNISCDKPRKAQSCTRSIQLDASIQNIRIEKDIVLAIADETIHLIMGDDVTTWNLSDVGAKDACLVQDDVILVLFDDFLEAYRAGVPIWKMSSEYFTQMNELAKLGPYLLLSLERQTAPIEVIDVRSLLESSDNETMTTPKSHKLEDYWVLPKQGKEWKDHIGTAKLYPINEDKCAVLTSNGFGVVQLAGNEWEMADEPKVSLEFAGHAVQPILYKEKSHYAVSLRGGTVYLIPPDSSQPIPATMYPHDVEIDYPVSILQDFTAGTIQNIPVVYYLWPGGIVEVYALQLLPKMYNEAIDKVVSFVTEHQTHFADIYSEIKDKKVTIAALQDFPLLEEFLDKLNTPLPVEEEAPKEEEATIVEDEIVAEPTEKPAQVLAETKPNEQEEAEIANENTLVDVEEKASEE